jgi:hypothetical protein
VHFYVEFGVRIVLVTLDFFRRSLILNIPFTWPKIGAVGQKRATGLGYSSARVIGTPNPNSECIILFKARIILSLTTCGSQVRSFP